MSMPALRPALSASQVLSSSLGTMWLWWWWSLALGWLLTSGKLYTKE